MEGGISKRYAVAVAVLPFLPLSLHHVYYTEHLCLFIVVWLKGISCSHIVAFIFRDVPMALEFLIAFFAAIALIAWVWSQAPVVVIYGGACSYDASFEVYIQYIRERWAFATMVTLCPPQTVGKIKDTMNQLWVHRKASSRNHIHSKSRQSSPH